MLNKRQLALILMLGLLSATSPRAIVYASSGTPDTDALIPDGIEINVISIQEISSKTAREGDPVTFRVDDDLVIDDQIVVVKGTLVKGTISNAESSGRLGKGGKLGIRVESTTTVDGQRLKLRASEIAAGADKTAATVVLVALVGVFGFLKKGDNAKIKSGTKIKVYTDESKRVRLKNGGLI